MTIVLAHGAGAGCDHPWMKRVAVAFGAHGIDVVRFNFPYMEEKRRVPDRGPVLEAHVARVWQETAAEVSRPMIAGGKSMGGRIASQAAAKGLFDPAPAGLIFFGYPLHPPGKPDQRRDGHLPSINIPMLFLQGTRDPFGTPEEMDALVVTLPLATLETIEGGDHSLVVGKRLDPAGDSVERAVASAAMWARAL